jgi:hypothetical protein
MFELPNSEQQRNDPFNGRDVATNSGQHLRGGEVNVNSRQLALIVEMMR